MTAPSRRTLTIGATGILLVAMLWLAMMLVDADSFIYLAISDLGEAFIITICAAIVLGSAVLMGPGPYRRQWLFVGAGVAAFAIGDLVWSYIELVQGVEVPYPGVPDLFYLSEYVLLSTGILIAGFAYKPILDIKVPALIATGITFVVGLGLWFAFISPLAADADSTALERMVNTFYPMADILLLAGPALFVILVVMRLGTGRLGRPWWAVAAGALILAVSDTAFSWMSVAETYEPGSFVDMGWMLAHVAIAVGALIALDLVGGPVSKPASKREPLPQAT